LKENVQKENPTYFFSHFPLTLVFTYVFFEMQIDRSRYYTVLHSFDCSALLFWYWNLCKT